MAEAASPVRTLPKRDRLAILVGLGGITLLAWVYLIKTAREMSGMPGMSMAGMPEMLELRAWTSEDFLLMFLMWAVMMVGMMVPTAVPMTLIYAAIVRRAASQNNPLAPAAVFVAGYVSMWTLFSAVATLLQWTLERAALLSTMMVSTSPVLGAGILIVAGVYQWTPFKDTCLKQCRMPAQFFSEHWKDGTPGAFRMGFVYGAFCLGCCAFLMLLLFLGGVMNLLWIAAIALFVLAEKISPLGNFGGRAAGTALILLGILALASSLLSLS
jgi:predicted metal-binding membrane protein